MLRGGGRLPLALTMGELPPAKRSKGIWVPLPFCAQVREAPNGTNIAAKLPRLLQQLPRGAETVGAVGRLSVFVSSAPHLGFGTYKARLERERERALC